jgi:hypothetical protein
VYIPDTATKTDIKKEVCLSRNCFERIYVPNTTNNAVKYPAVKSTDIFTPKILYKTALNKYEKGPNILKISLYKTWLYNINFG